MSSSKRRNSGPDDEELARRRASVRDRFAVSERSSSHCATSTGEYFPETWPFSNAAACCSMVEKSSGSSGLTVPNRFGVGVSEYGSTSLPSTMGMFVYISGQKLLFEAEGKCAVVSSGRTRLAFERACSIGVAAFLNSFRRYRCQPPGSASGE